MEIKFESPVLAGTVFHNWNDLVLVMGLGLSSLVETLGLFRIIYWTVPINRTVSFLILVLKAT